MKKTLIIATLLMSTSAFAKNADKINLGEATCKREITFTNIYPKSGVNKVTQMQPTVQIEQLMLDNTHSNKTIVYRYGDNAKQTSTPLVVSGIVDTENGKAIEANLIESETAAVKHSGFFTGSFVSKADSQILISSDKVIVNSIHTADKDNNTKFVRETKVTCYLKKKISVEGLLKQINH